MAPLRWSRIGELFDRASTLPETEQIAFLEKACAGDAALIHDVRSLLDADRDTHALLDRETIGIGTWIEEVEAYEPLDEHVGAYQIVRLLGTGGMGRVYLADRADGLFEHHVALKVVKRGMDSDPILRRFASERQILARLEHPHIARLLDGGVTPDGRPFFAMDYVEGVPIDRYCDAQKLNVEERLRLFLQVCDAVRYAHQNLVVHRDLKPDNILVTEEGTPKLLDFGIAKVLEADAEAITRTGGSLMTPEYASPEQVRGDTISTASDVYTLGVILYELLTGTRPYATAGRGPLDVARAVLTEEPPRPSTVIRTAEATTEQVSDKRRTQPQKLRRTLAGDLDAVCLKALRKDPDDRYATVTELADDVERHLQGLPVRARRGTTPYRVRKFVERHRAGVFITASVVLFAVAFAFYHTTTLRHERDVARREAAKAEQTADFLTSIFEVSDPAEAQGREVTARELLDAGAARIQTELADQPLVRASLLETLGNVYRELSLFEEAKPLLEASLALRMQHLGPRHPETATAQVAVAMLLQDLGDPEGALPLFEEALATRRALLPPDDPDIEESVAALAFLHETLSEPEKAEPLYREALALEQRAAPEGSPLAAKGQVSLANFLRTQERYDEAEPLLRDALAYQRAHFDGPHPDLASTLRSLASLLRDTERRDEADTLYQEAIAMRRALHGEYHTEVGNLLNSYAQLLQDKGEYDHAMRVYDEVIDIFQHVYGKVHPSLAAVYNNIALVRYDIGDYARSEELYQACIDVQDELLDPENPNRSYPLYGLGQVYLKQHRSAEAVPLFRRALELRKRAFDADHRFVLDAEALLGEALLNIGRRVEARPYITHSYERFLETRGPDDGRTQGAKERLDRLNGSP